MQSDFLFQALYAPEGVGNLALIPNHVPLIQIPDPASRRLPTPLGCLLAVKDFSRHFPAPTRRRRPVLPYGLCQRAGVKLPGLVAERNTRYSVPTHVGIRTSQPRNQIRQVETSVRSCLPPRRRTLSCLIRQTLPAVIA